MAPGTGPDLGITTVARSLDPAAARSNGTHNGTSVDFKGAGGRAVMVVYSAAGTGTAPTLDVTLQDSADDSSFAANAEGTAATQITTSASLQKIRFNARRARRYVRASALIAGAAGGGFIFSVHFEYEQRPTVG